VSLTAAQKATVKRHLGYHAVAQSLYPIVDGFYTVDTILSALPAETETQVVEILTRLGNIETQLDSAPANLTLEKAEDVTFRGPGELDGLWVEVKRWRVELSTLTGIPMRRGGAAIVVT
jgi:hypothetical protein